MRTRMMILTGALLLVFSGAARAQQEQAAATTTQSATAAAKTTTPFTPKFGSVDFGFRSEDITGDNARYQRYQDLRKGAYVGRFNLARETEQWALNAAANNVGYRDQQYSVQYESIGKLKVSGEWNQVPLWISSSTATIYKANGGVLNIDDSLQRSLQNAGSPTGAAAYGLLNTALGAAAGYDLRSRRDIGFMNLAYSFNRDIDLKVDVRTMNRTGDQLMSFGFGTSPGLVPALEFAVPTDDRTTDVRSYLEIANDRGLLNVGYSASWFDNKLPTVTFDNPFRADDISGGASKGLAPMWASNQAYNFNVNGSYKLPGRSRASAFVSIGQWSQNEALVAPTVNSALFATMPALDRPTAEAKADIVSMVYNFTSRPSDFLWLNAKYRYYDYANKTPHYETLALIGDWTVGTALFENEPSSIKRNTLDLDASVDAGRYFAIGAGYSHEDYDRTFRIYEKTAEDTYRFQVDSTGNQYVQLRTKYEHSNREGSEFDAHLLAEVGEQPGMRHFDIATRERDRVLTTLSIMPVKYFEFSTSFGWGQDEYNETQFGLQSNDSRNWDVGVSVTPMDKVSFGVNYGEEKYTALQYSRTANPAPDPTFTDPTRDWWIDQEDEVKTFSANADFMKVIPKTDIRFWYDISDGSGIYFYNMKPEQRVFTTVPLSQLSPLSNKLVNTRFDVQYYIRPNLAVGGAYWYDDYGVTDFALTSTTLDKLAPANGTTGVFASTIYSGYLYRDYTAHTGWVRLTVLW